MGSECTRRQRGPYGHPRVRGRQQQSRREEATIAIGLRRRRARARRVSGLRWGRGGGAPGGRVRGGGLGWGWGGGGGASRACAQWPESGGAGPRGACAAAWAAGPSLGGGARRGRPHGEGEVRWPPPPPAPQSVARRKMADLEEQLSDEEKVGAAAAGAQGGRERVARPAGRSLSPGRALGVGRTPRLPERGAAPGERGPAAPCRVCAPKIGSGAGRAGAAAAGPGLGVRARARWRAVRRRLAWGCHRGAGGRGKRLSRPSLFPAVSPPRREVLPGSSGCFLPSGGRSLYIPPLCAPPPSRAPSFSFINFSHYYLFLKIF